ncbi:MAG TPA: glycosyltransferase family 1 protein [Candidatus Dormibacteraeota bacterium]|jgi:glycosyltransferase involved in cell wall biosynthesis|nr:glycosyltransferase family 1 protein [Candidatus Dormibacteraeota bacterium]
MNAPKVAFDLTALQNSHQSRGIGTYVRGLAAELNRQSQIPIEFWGWSGDLPFEPRPPHTLLSLRRPPMPAYRASWLFAQFGLSRRNRASDVRVVHVTDPQALTALPGRITTTTVYDLIPLLEGIPLRSPLERIGYARYLRALRRVPMVLAISEATQKDLETHLGFAPGRAVLAPPGVDIALRDARPTCPPSDDRYFLYYGGPNANKNLAGLLQAAALCADLPEEVWLAGPWPDEHIRRFERAVDRYPALRGRVRYLGFLAADDLRRLIRGATAIVLPSLWEGFGLPVAEAMALHAAVIHSDIPALREVSAGVAVTFDPERPLQLAEAMRRLSTDPELVGRLRLDGARRAAEFTWDQALAATLDVYDRLLSGRLES